MILMTSCLQSRSSLRNLDYSSENVDIENNAKTENSRPLSNANSKSNESVKSPSKKSKRSNNKKSQNEDEHSWLRSTSCKNLYQQESSSSVTENQKNPADPFRYEGFKIGFDSPITRYDDSRRGCYSAVASKTSSIDRAGDVITDARIYSSSYPGTTSSLSTESVEGEPMFDANDSQEEVVLSHDDVSHDSYELLEKDFDDFDEDRTRRGRKYFSENERARSCSWGSDKGEPYPQLDSRSSDKIYGQDYKKSRENGFRSLERSKSPKHKSETDFRSLERKSPKNVRSRLEGTRAGDRKYATDYRRKPREYYGNGADLRRSKEIDDKAEGLDGRAFNVDDDALYDNDPLYSRIQDVRPQKKPTEIFRMDSEEEYMDEKKKMERKREKRDKEDRFHEGLKEQTDLERRLYERKKEEEKEENLYGNKLERVFSNQFGKYPEFLGYNPDYELLKHERKVSENYEKVCQVGKIAKELERTEKALSERMQVRKIEPDVSKVQKDGGKESGKKPFRVSQFNEYNAKTKAGTVIGFASPKASPKAPVERTKSDPYDTTKNSKRNVLMHQKSIDLTPQDSAEVTSDYDNDDGIRKTSRSEHDIPYTLRKRHFMNGTAKDSDVKLKAEHRKTIEIINLDAKDEKSVTNLLQNKKPRPALAKKPILTDEKKSSPKITPKKEAEKADHKEVKEKPPNESDYADDLNEPIYAQVVKGKVVEPTETKDTKVETKKKIPPAPPKRTSSVVKVDVKKDQPKPPERTSSLPKAKKTPPEPPKRTTSVQKKSPEPKPEMPKTKPEFPGIVAHRREELFARTRLGLSEGSAFTPISRQGHFDSPSSQRRAKSLDAPVISVHRLPPADAFSSKDDTVDENEGDMMKYVRSTESSKEKMSKTESLVDTTISTESEMDVFLPEDGDIDKNFKETVESQTKMEVNYPEEKVLDSVRSKRLLSKIDSMDSEGDLDSSRKAEPLPIPSDRLVNLPESVRFPSVRQISGQTSEESADGWEQREVKVKRRTPRRSVGREDQDVGLKESVVWDSKDDEPPDDDVWDSNAVFTIKQSQTKPEPEYLKRGSCGQSIDDDNVSTPMKESSPEHWVSVDDLPEAIEREERFLREQEKILREKILNEKLKRELNLDTIDVDRRQDGSKEKFKGHSLDTYELTEKRLRERGTNKNCSLDEHILRQSPIKNYLSVASDLDLSEKSSSYENVPKKAKCQTEYIKVVNNVNEIDQFGDNDEELEEFVVVLDEGLSSKDERDLLWDDVSFRRSLSKEESLISVPEEFKDVEDEVESELKPAETLPMQKVEIKLNEGEASSRKESKIDDLDYVSAEDAVGKIQDREDPGRLSPFRDTEEKRRLSASEDTGRLSPYDSSSRRGSDDPRRGSASDDAGRLSPYDDSRRGSEDPRRLSTSEDSKHYSVSESVSEETRRRLSSTEETRRKRASLTKQCSVGIDSLSDDMIPGIQECSSSFEQDEKDVFEPVPELTPETKDKVKEVEVKKLEIEVSEDTSDTKDSGIEDEKEEVKDTSNHLAPPTSERELSRETEDSMDYGEGDFKDIREIVKDQDISDGPVCENGSAIPDQKGDRPSTSFEKSDLSEQDELRFIDDKRGSTPDILVGKGKEAAAISVVVVNEGISVLNKIVGKEKSRTLPKAAVAGTSSTSTDSETTSEEQRHTLPKMTMKPKPLTPKPDYIHRKLTKAVPNIKMKPPIPEKPTLSSLLVETSQESSQDSDVDRLTEVSLLAQIQSQIARRNLADTGKRLRREIVEMASKENEGKDKSTKTEEKSPEQEKRDSGEDMSSSSSAPPHPKRELSSTWRPFLLESSGSSSLEEGWLPPDDNAHLADEEETSSNSNNQQDDSIHDDIDYPTGIGYPVLNLSSAEMMVGGYSSVFALSRTLSRISERSTSEQERSDAEDDVTKPSSHSVSIEEESIISSDHQPSLSSDSPSPKAGGSNIPDLPDDRSPIPDNFLLPEDKAQNIEPFSGVIPPPVTDEDWPSPPSSSSVFDTPIVSHVETFYMEIHPEEAYKVVVSEPQHGDNSSSDENQTLQEEGELLHLSSDNLSLSTTTTTQDGTVVIPVHPPNVRTNSVSEDTSIMSTSDWSSSTNVRHRANSNFGTTEDLSDWTKSSSAQNGAKHHSKQIGSTEEISDWSKKQAATYSKSDEISSENLGSRLENWQQSRSSDTSQFGTVSGWSTSSSSKYSPDEQEPVSKPRPPKLKSPPSKNMGFFETPISKVRSPTSQMKFFERPEKSHSSVRSPTSRSESASPKNHGRFFDSPSGIYHTLMTDYYDLHKVRSSPTYGKHAEDSDRRSTCTPYYSNVAEKAERSYYGQYDTGSLERTKMQPSRKSISYHSMRVRGNEDEGSSNDTQSPPPTSNTIPRASKKCRRRHRVAIDIQIRDGKIVAPPKTRTTVLDNSDSDRSSPSFSSRRKKSDP
ncbi:UNVERIFIED_CONTAM: hypothetical protein PYX00_002511 [Menopon gallinae]|uniref:Uncharacterized protein n=1 Tax=Menopon gallinae TaxID=328185 RepID=A0AAW2IIE7_9NEOP